MEHETWYVRLFGGLDISSKTRTATFRTKKTANLVALLALHPGESFRRDWLAERCWPHVDHFASRQSLRMALSDIRSVLGEHTVKATRDQVSLDATFVRSDVEDLEANLSAAKDRSELGRALALVSGLFLPEFDADWVASEWMRLQETIARSTVRYLSMCEDDPSGSDGTQVGKRMLSLIGCREDIHIGIMKLYIARGTPSLAIAQFDELERQLDDLWGEPPSQTAIDLIQKAPRSNANADVRRGVPGPHSLIGRDELIGQVMSLLESASSPRILTLIGPGGSGKTSVAHVVFSSCPEPSWFVDLTSETSESGVLLRIHSAIGLGSGEGDLLPPVVRQLASTPALLILDNCEQALEPVANLIAKLLDSVPTLRLLVTSRIALGLDAEQLIPVGSLRLPEPKMNLREIRETPVIRLFERQAELVNPAFSVNADNVKALVELCRVLDGLPLAICLAAARTIIRSPAEILNRVQRSLASLDSRTAIPDRHRSLSQTIGWSYENLSPDAQEVALGLSLFVGAFGHEDIGELLGDDDFETGIEELVRASILNVDQSSGTSEFWMYETLRQHMHARLKGPQSRPDLVCRFLRLQAAKARAIESNSAFTGDQKMRRHLKNSAGYLDALAWCVPSRLEPSLCAQLLIDFARAASLYGLIHPLCDFTLEVIQWKDELPDLQRAMVGEAHMHITADQGDNIAQVLFAHECVTLAGDSYWGQTVMRTTRGTLLKTGGHFAEALVDCNHALEHCRKEDHVTRSRALFQAAMIVNCMEDYPRSLELLYEALEEARQSHEPSFLIRILYYLGSELAIQGRGRECGPFFEEAIELCRQLDSRKMEGLTRWQQGEAMMAMGQTAEALATLKKSLHLIYDSGFVAGLQRTLLIAADAFAAEGQYEVATKLLSKWISSMSAQNKVISPDSQRSLERIKATLSSHLDASEHARLWSEGAHLSWDQLVREVLADTVVA